MPELLFTSRGAAGLGAAGMIMRRVPGETIARKILRDEQYEQARGLVVRQLGQFAAGPARAGGQAGSVLLPDAGPAGQPARTAGRLRRDGQRSEVFELAYAELAASPPPAREPVLLHGDFRLGNLIVGPEGLAAVLDWELTHLGNPAEDLGWLCVKAWRFGAGLPVAGMGSREELLAAYREAGGADISLAELRWWEILGTLRWGVICMTQASVHLSGAYQSVELAAIGRRVCEQEWDLLLLLEPAAAAAAAARRPRPSGEPAGRTRALRPADGERTAGRRARLPDRSGHARDGGPAGVPRAGGRERARDRGPRA